MAAPEHTALRQQLHDMASELSEQIASEAQVTMHAAEQELVESGILKQSLGMGDQAPDFRLPNALGDEVRLRSLLDEGPVVLSFYRGGWCPYCNLELQALQQAVAAIEQAGATLVAVSPQTPDHSLSTAEKHALSFEVLSDIGNDVAREYGLVFRLPQSLRNLYTQFGINVPEHNGDDSFELPIPATYVIDCAGIIEFAFVNTDYKQRAEPAEIVLVLEMMASGCF